MHSRIEPHDEGSLLEATRQALAACSDGLDLSAVGPETPLAAVLFDSLAVLKFIATLEANLGLSDLPFERWLAENSERTDGLTIGSLVDWLRSLPEVAGTAEVGRHTDPRGAPPEDG